MDESGECSTPGSSGNGFSFILFSIMLVVCLLCLAFTMLTYIYAAFSFFRDFSMKICWIFVKSFFLHCQDSNCDFCPLICLDSEVCLFIFYWLLYLFPFQMLFVPFPASPLQIPHPIPLPVVGTKNRSWSSVKTISALIFWTLSFAFSLFFQVGTSSLKSFLRLLLLYPIDFV